MKFKVLIGVGVAGCLALSAWSQTVPSYTTLNATGTTAATVYFPASPLQQLRIVGAIATSDKAGSVLSFTTGTAAYTVTTASAAGTNIIVASTNGLAASDVIIVQQSGTNWAATIHSFPASTNIAVTAAAPATLVGAEVFKQGTATTIKCGATTAVYTGEAIYVGNRGRPVRVVVDGTSAVSADSITGRYE